MSKVHTSKIRRLALAAGCLAAAFAVSPASAQDTYRLGISAGLTGYAATVDRAWSDAVQLAAEAVNSRGGVMGRKLQVIVEDNRSEPQEAVTVYRKMISSDQVNVFTSGCVSAGNFAAAGLVVRAQIPMVLCSILPQQPDHVKWAFTTIPPPRFDHELTLRSRTGRRQASTWRRCLAPSTLPRVTLP